MIETRNARITSTMLGREDHGILTFFLFLDYGGSSQGAGGYGLDQHNKVTNSRVGYRFGSDLLARIMGVVGVEKWEDLAGKHVRAKADYSKVYAVGNFLTDDWIDFAELFESHKEATP